MLFELALILVDGIGPITAKNLISSFGSAEQVFRQKPGSLLSFPGVTSRSVSGFKSAETLRRAELEHEFCRKNDIEIIYHDSHNYPQKLKHCEDSPLLLFVKGKGNLNPDRMISVVGTRGISAYGNQVCREILEGLASYKPTIVSGLALGVDTLAHKLALEHGLETIASVAHSLDRIYPSENRLLAKEIVENGALISEYFSGSKPDKENFPKRNRIVAGISSATIVIETAVKGGSMITADLALDYSRDVIAVPGRVSDPSFAGCNRLIAGNKAAIYTGVDELVRLLGWEERKPKRAQQKAMLFDLSDDEQLVVNYLKGKGQAQIDMISLDLNWPLSKLNAQLMAMELKGCVRANPGKVFSL